MENIWIEINLPWYVRNPKPPTKPYPNLDKEIKKKFGYTINDLEEKYFPTSEREDGWRSEDVTSSTTFKNFLKEQDRLREEFDIKNLSLENKENKELVIEEALLNSSLECVKTVLEYRKKKREIEDWHYNHPKMQKIAAENDAIYKAHEDAGISFCGKKLNKPGTIIQFIKNNETVQYIIGDINTSGGVCDDCVGIDNEDIIIRYKTLSMG